MNLYLSVLKAKEGDSKALDDIIKTYKIFANIQMRKHGVDNVESCYSEIVDRICECVYNYRAVKTEWYEKIA